MCMLWDFVSHTFRDFERLNFMIRSTVHVMGHLSSVKHNGLRISVLETVTRCVGTHVLEANVEDICLHVDGHA